MSAPPARAAARRLIAPLLVVVLTGALLASSGRAVSGDDSCAGSEQHTAIDSPAPGCSPASDALTISLAVTGTDRASLQGAIDDLADPASALSARALALLDAQRRHAPAGTSELAGLDDLVFDGTVQTVGDRIVVTVPGADAAGRAWGPRTPAVTLLASVVAVQIGARARCATSLRSAAPGVCDVVARTVAGLAGHAQIGALLGAPGPDADAWAASLARGLTAALLPGAGAGPSPARDATRTWLHAHLGALIGDVGRALVALRVTGPAAPSGAGTITAGPAVATASAGRALAAAAGRTWDAVVHVARAQGVPLALPQVRVMPLGDSITFGAGSTTLDGYRGELWAGLRAGNDAVDLVGTQHGGSVADADHEGHSGWRIAAIAAIAQCSVAYYRPNIVILHAGTNDLNQDDAVATAPDRLIALVRRIQVLSPGTTVLVATLVPANDRVVQRRIVAFNQRITALVRQEAAAGARVRLVDLGAVTTGDLADTLHPSDAGYRIMGRAFTAAVARAAADGIVVPVTGGREGPGPCTAQVPAAARAR